ncbi:unnamed protein product, partial [marine sediment metagenome]
NRFEISPDLQPTLGDWSNYPMTVARRLARNFPPALRGASMAFASDLPAASGMSSSSAMMIATYLSLAAINELNRREEYRREIDSPQSLAGYLATVENGQSFGTLTGDKGVGTFGGSEDHTAILSCRPGRLSQYSFCPVRFERFVNVPKGYVFAIAFSGVVAAKTGEALEKYNRASGLAGRAAQAWREATGRDDPHLAAVFGSSADAVELMRKVLSKATAGEGDFTPEQLWRRFEHYFRESEEIIPAAG